MKTGQIVCIVVTNPVWQNSETGTAVFPTPLPCLRYAERVMGCYKHCCCQDCLGGDTSCKNWKINSCRSVMMCAKKQADTVNNSDGTEVKDQRCSLVSKFSLLNKYLIFSRQSSRRSTFNILFRWRPLEAVASVPGWPAGWSALAQTHWHHSSSLIHFSMQRATELPMGESFSLKVGCSWLRKRMHWFYSYVPNSEKFHMNLMRRLPSPSFTLPVFVYSARHAALLFPSVVSTMSNSSSSSLPSCARILYLPHISDLVISLLLVSVGHFGGEFLSVLPGLYLAESAVATAASICLPVSHVLSFCGPVWSPPAWE